MSSPGDFRSPLPGATGPPLAESEIERLRANVGVFFPVYETRITPNSVLFLVAAEPATLAQRFDQLRRELWEKYYVPFIRHDRGEYVVEVLPRPRRRTFGLIPNALLLVATVATTVLSGALLWLTYTGASHLGAVDFLWGGLSFSLPIMGILGLHELAHYVMARYHHVEASLPYFLPVPPPVLFGTFGAFISIREPIPDRKALLDIGASGPITGFVASIPITIFGLYLSAHAPVLPLNNCGVTFLGANYSSLVYGLSLFWVILGQFVPIGYANLSPVALAGWVGLLVTAINLLPAGQLDGGHVYRALLGDRSRYVSWGATLLLFGLGIYTLYLGWFFFGIVVFFLGLRHPPPLNDITPLDGKRWVVGGACTAIILVAFVLIPVSLPTGTFALIQPGGNSLTPPPPGYGMAGNLSAKLTNKDFVSHGYYFSGNVTSVTSTVGNGSRPLNGSAFTNFVRNSTWIVYLPNGTPQTFALQSSFNFGAGQYVTVGAGTSIWVRLSYLNTAQGTVTITLKVNEVCSSSFSGPSNQVQSLTLPPIY